MLRGGAKGLTEGLRQQLAAGTPVEVAGYAIAPALAQGMEHAVLEPPAATAAHTGYGPARGRRARRRASNGHSLGDWQPIEGEVSEMRVNFGPGYRL